MIRLFPSSNPSPEDKILEYIDTLQKSGAEFLHCDVMDGMFVPNKCLDISLLEEISRKTTIGMDIHLMMIEPMTNIQKYIHLPATYITTHFEAYNNVQNLVKISKYVRSNKRMMGISLKPNTPISSIKKLLPLFDLVLLMSVEPGKSGQTFIESTYSKISELRELIDSSNLNIKIQVDGGINEENMQKVVDAGADILVMGNAVYLNRDKENLFRKVKMMYRKKTN